MISQSGDVLISVTDDGFEMSHTSGMMEMTESLETIVALSLFGGNDTDNGSQATEAYQWWGNENEPKERVLRSEFQTLLTGGPITSRRMFDLSDAAKRDLERDLIGNGLAKGVSTRLSMRSNKSYLLEIELLLNGNETGSINFEIAV